MPKALAVLAGVLVALHWPWALWPGYAVSALGVAAVCVWRRRLRGLSAASLAFAATLLAEHHQLGQHWPQECGDERVLALVSVDSIPVPAPYGTVFDARVRVLRGAAPRELRARIVWRASPRTLRPGDRWTLLLALRAPRGFVDPGAVDLEKLLFREGLHATATVVDSALNRLSGTARFDLDRVRQRLAEGIRARVPERDAATLLAALAVGYTAEMSREQWRIFNATGTAHLVAISGLHVTFFAVLAFAVARRVWGPLTRLGLRLPRESFAASTGLGAAAAYALLAGFSVPAQRTLLMLAAWAVARHGARPAGAARVFAVALVAVLLIDFRAPLAPGFWLSFIAVGVILLTTGTRVLASGMAASALRVQLAVFVGLVPATLALFGRLSLAGLVVNFAAIPFFTFALVPLALAAVVTLLCTPSLAIWPLGAAEWLHGWGWPWLAAAADWPLALIAVTPAGWWYLLALPAAVALLLPLPWPLRASGLLACLPLATSPRWAVPPASVALDVLEVGRGTAVVVRTARHTILFGTGEVRGSDGERIERIVLPWLRAHSVRALDALIVGGVNADRAAGAAVLAAAMAVRRVYVGDEWPGAILPVQRCASAGAWRWDEVSFRMLTSAGSTACSLFIDSPGGRALIAGDLDALAERTLSGAYALRAEVALVPRSGSAAASSTALVAAVSPRWALVSAPAEAAGTPGTREVLARWQAQGAQPVLTGLSGALHLRIAARGGPRLLGRARCDRPRPWRARCIASEFDAMAQARWPGTRGPRYDARSRRTGERAGDVGNRAGRWPAHVADHPVLDRSSSDHSRAALDAPGEARAAARAPAEDLAAGREQPDQRQGDRRARAELAARQGARRRPRSPAPPARDHDGAPAGHGPPRRARARALSQHPGHHRQYRSAPRSARDRDGHHRGLPRHTGERAR
ncbi:MAG: DNA internalization-related competence protein ComEC/Rec2 [Gammaproteobacteria bacterium]|nr:DNA internalization-related competence protein ComEC/Rec2 [Gammaproteobacteria bacterium]